MFGLGRGIIEATGGGGTGTGDSGALAPISSGGGGSGGGYIAPLSAPTYSAPTYSAPSYSAPVTAVTSSGQIVTLAPASAGAAQAGVFGEGVYTPLDYPAMRFLGADQRLSDLNAVTAPVVAPVVDLPSLLFLGAVAYLLLK